MIDRPILGWVRQGDYTSCGGVVVGGSKSEFQGGRAYTFVGATIACRKRCSIAQGLSTCILSNGAAMVHHGHRTSAGCLLISSLNGVDGHI